MAQHQYASHQDHPDEHHLATSPVQSALKLLNAWKAFSGSHEILKRDRIARRWIRHKYSPYRNEVDATSSALGTTGAYALNLLPYLGSTTGINDQNVLFHTMDKRADIFGDAMTVSHRDTPCGPYTALTWPGYAGVRMGAAPGRFAICYNEVPSRFGWWRKYMSMPAKRKWPPAWLVRHIFETCQTYDEAKYRLCTEHVLIPGIFTLISPTGQSCIIERTQKQHVIHSGNALVAGNHFQNGRFEDVVNIEENVNSSLHRTAAMRQALRTKQTDPFYWCTPPVRRSELTRFALEIDLSANTLTLWRFGTEKTKPEIISLLQQ